jgi:phosphopantothenoylcysteine decarboxylase/phosphopantothenate--cysteine ligase
MKRAPQRILLGVTGGIAAYKSAELVRLLKADGHDVQVVMTPAATAFIGRTTLQALSGRPVRDDLWDEAAEAAMGHIELARWADLVLIAPATADFLARLAAGRADDLLATLCLATEAPVVCAPAMNRVMWAHPATRANVATLTSRGVRMIGPDEGDQACGETGPGRMTEPAAIVRALAAGAAGPLAGATLVVTAGPTREPIDPVRYVTNRSSGKMGFAVAAAAARAGAAVTLVAGPVQLSTPPGVERIDVETAEEMLAAVEARIAGTDVFVAAAAVADYRPEAPAGQKIKKTTETMALELTRTPDTLARVAARPDRPFTVGFAAETEEVERYAREKLVAKRLDMIAANRVGGGAGFDVDDNELIVLWPGGRRELGRASKAELAEALIALIAERCRGARELSGAAAR